MLSRAFGLAVAFFLMRIPLLSGQVTGVTSLRALRDQARPLLIFAPKPEDPRLELQVRTLEQHPGQVQERQLVVITLPYGDHGATEAQLSPDEARAARRRFHVAPGDFAVILIGKDGGAKLRSSEPLPMATLNGTIDAMPMRQEELNSKPKP